jgi:FKBP-type peptidyl-prolyl cis-trans isomerase 2
LRESVSIGDTNMADQQASGGDAVAVHYTGRLDDGQVFDSSQAGEPLSFVLGTGQVIAGFDAGVEGLAVGESQSIRIEPEDAYGERDESMVVAVPKEQAPEDLAVGTRVMLGEHAAVVVDVTPDSVVVDANHPLAGQALTFDLQLVSIDRAERSC